MHRYEKFFSQTGKGKTFQILDETKGEVFAKEIRKKAITRIPIIQEGEYAEDLSIYIDQNGNQAVIPQGWTAIEESKLVIYKIPKRRARYIDWSDMREVRIVQETFDQFIWVNMSSFPISEIEAILPMELIESMYIYNGFYVSRFAISESKKNGRLRSVSNAEPIKQVSRYVAKNITLDITDKEEFIGKLISNEECEKFFGAEEMNNSDEIVQFHRRGAKLVG